MVDRSGQPDERNSSKAQIRTLLESKDRQLLGNIARESVITNSKQLKPKKNAEFYEKNYGDSKWIFVKFTTKSYRDGGITKIPKFYIRHARKTEAHRRPEHYFGIIK